MPTRSLGCHPHHYLPAGFRVLLLALATSATPVLALDASDSGATGANGTSGLIGTKGGNGGGALVNLVTPDYFNTATATAGKGGNGGNSLPLFFGANGGNGGGANATLQSGGQAYTYANMEVNSSVKAIGGDGGNGGTGLLPGNGGAGGAATATGADTGGFQQEPDFAVPSVVLIVDANAGNGGSGRNGGAGGASTASSSLSGSPASPGIVGATARGGAGGDALLRGGKGGNATADTVYNNGGFPSDNFATATALGGNGGTSTFGLNGNGGSASATAFGAHSARDLSLTVEARATGGNSGTTGAFRGNGGDAYAEAIGHALYVAGVSPVAIAQGGDGVVRGGNAIATAEATSDLMFGGASARAGGGAGQHAGAAIATAVSTAPYLGNDANATATYAGPFVKSVSAYAASFSLDNPVTTTLAAQARAGDTGGLSVPALPINNGFATAVAPTPQEAAAILIGNPNSAAAFAGGKVWGSGAIGNLTGADSFGAGSSFTFDISDIAPQHLLLGLLDSNLASTSVGDFHFSITGEGTTLFDHDFTGSDFLTFFDDRIFDLGSWANLVGSDGLFDLAFSFTGSVPEIEFAFGQAAATSTSVPEPSALVLLIAGLLGLLIASKDRRSGD